MLSRTPPEKQLKESHMKQTNGIVDTGNQSSDFIPIERYSSFNKLMRSMATVHVASQHQRDSEEGKTGDGAIQTS